MHIVVCLLLLAPVNSHAISPVTADELTEVNLYTDSWAFGNLVQGPEPDEIYLASFSNGVSLLNRDSATGALSFVDNISLAGLSISDIVFSANGDFVLANAVRGIENEIVIFNRAADGRLTFVESLSLSTLISGASIRNIGELRYSSDRKYIYATARRVDLSGMLAPSPGIVYFSLDSAMGAVAFEDAYWADDGFPSLSSLVTIEVSPDGRHVYSAETNAIDSTQRRLTIFERNAATGVLTVKASGGVVLLGSVVSASGRGARKLQFASDTTLYMSTQNGLNVLTRDPTTGDLNQKKAILQLGFAGNTDVQYAAHIAPSPDGRRVYTAIRESYDGGWSSQITEYMRSNDGSSLILSNAGQEVGPGAEFGDLLVSADSRYVYARRSVVSPGLAVYERTPDTRTLSVANELVNQGTPRTVPENPAAAASLGNRDVYIGGEDNIALYHRDVNTRELVFVEMLSDNSLLAGSTVRELKGDPSGAFVYAALVSGHIVVLQRDAVTGSLTALAG